MAKGKPKVTEQERAFEAWWDADVNNRFGRAKQDAKECFLSGWKRERAKAKPASVEGPANNPGVGWNLWVSAYCQHLPAGARIRVTVEEV
jgi:hypothetical protein